MLILYPNLNIRYSYSLKNVGLDRNSGLHTISDTSNQRLWDSFFIKSRLSIDYSPEYHDVCVQESDMPHGNKRRFLKVIGRNNGWRIAENCEAESDIRKYNKYK